ncbi:MAG: hypothetical protein ACK5JH_02790 [Anaerocolumna sp.]
MDKIIFGGFSFTQGNRDFDCIYVRNYDCIYGDSYVIENNRVEKVGNNVAIEFPSIKEYTEIEFTLDSVTGRHNVSFVFIPGSNFDFEWLQFERI